MGHGAGEYFTTMGYLLHGFPFASSKANLRKYASTVASVMVDASIHQKGTVFPRGILGPQVHNSNLQ